MYNVKDYSFLYNNLFDILVTGLEHLHDCLILLTVEYQAYKPILAPSVFIKVPVPSQKSEQSCICIRYIDFVSF